MEEQEGKYVTATDHLDKNICCPMLTIIDCADTDDHCHLLCQSDNHCPPLRFVIDFCFNKWTDCWSWKTISDEEK